MNADLPSKMCGKKPWVCQRGLGDPPTFGTKRGIKAVRGQRIPTAKLAPSVRGRPSRQAPSLPSKNQRKPATEDKNKASSTVTKHQDHVTDRGRRGVAQPQPRNRLKSVPTRPKAAAIPRFNGVAKKTELIKKRANKINLNDGTRGAGRVRKKDIASRYRNEPVRLEESDSPTRTSASSVSTSTPWSRVERFCKNCGHERVRDACKRIAKFCGECGSRFSEI